MNFEKFYVPNSDPKMPLSELKVITNKLKVCTEPDS